MIKIKVIPDKIFHVLWDNAIKFENQEEYIRFFTSVRSKGYIDFYRICGINEADILDTLNSIYNAGNMTIKDILDRTGYKKIDISHMFCIPIRTLEDWYSGKSKCNSYIRLMLIREFELLDLGKWVETEYKNIKKRAAYCKNSHKITENRNDNNMHINIYNNKDIKEYKELYDNKNIKDHKEIYNNKDIKEYKEIYNNKDIKEYGEIYNNKDIKEYGEIYNNKDIKYYKEIYNNKDIKEHDEIYNNKDIKGFGEIYNNKDIKEHIEIYNKRKKDEEILKRIEQSRATAKILEQTNYLDKILNKKTKDESKDNSLE